MRCGEKEVFSRLQSGSSRSFDVFNSKVPGVMGCVLLSDRGAPGIFLHLTNSFCVSSGRLRCFSESGCKGFGFGICECAVQSGRGGWNFTFLVCG